MSTTATNLGIAVDLRLKSGTRVILRNVTEIHYNYNCKCPEITKHLGPQVAFESDVHMTGLTYRINDVNEFETYLETEVQPSF